MTQQAIVKKEPNAIEVGKRPLVMKSGLIHWLTPETASKLENSLASQEAHGFVKITELGITINTADIGDGILTMVQYSALLRKKQGDWQCEDSNWHVRTERSCTCKADRLEKARRRVEEERRAQENKPMTEEERKKSILKLKLTGEQMVLRGIIPHIGREIRRSTLEDWKESGEPMVVQESLLKIREDVL